MNHSDAERCDPYCFSSESNVLINNLHSVGAAFAGDNMNLTGYTLDKNIIERKMLVAVIRKRKLYAFLTSYDSF